MLRVLKVCTISEYYMICSKLACLFSGRPSIGLLLLRVPIGIIFMAHGAQKLFGWFGGDGLEGVIAQMASLNIEPALFFALVVTCTELFGGLMLVVGFITRLAALGLAIDMIVAIIKVHFPHGLLEPGGYQFPLALVAACVALLFTGPGSLAIDCLITRRCCKKDKDTKPLSSE